MDDDTPKPANSPKLHRRWLRFSLRTMMLAITLLCVWLGIISYRANRQKKAVETIKMAGGDVGYDYQTDGDGWPTNGDPPGPAWLRNLIGIDYLAPVVAVMINSEKGSPQDSVLALAELPQLTSLDIRGAGITDSTLSQIKGLMLLKNLCLINTQVTDAGLSNVTGSSRLKQLSLSGSDKITDASVQHLKSLIHLEYLYIRGTTITADGEHELKRALPQVRVGGPPR